MIKPFVQERFEAWLFAQPDQRPFNFENAHECVMGRFFQEAGFATISDISEDPGYAAKPELVPSWLWRMIRVIIDDHILRWGCRHRASATLQCEVCTIYAAEMKSQYMDRYPDMRRFLKPDLTRVALTGPEAYPPYAAGSIPAPAPIFNWNELLSNVQVIPEMGKTKPFNWAEAEALFSMAH